MWSKNFTNSFTSANFGCFSLQNGYNCGRFEILTALNLKITICWEEEWSSSHRHTTTQHTTPHSRRKGSIFDIVHLRASNARKFHHQLVAHVFFYFLDYTQLLDVSAIYPGHFQWVTSHNIVTTNSYTRCENLIPGKVTECRWDVESGKLVYSSTFGHVPTCVYVSHRPNELFVPEQQRK